MRRKRYNVRDKRENRKGEIVRAAVLLFMEKGFDGATLSDISERLNLGRTTLYEYFKNKDEILAAYLEKEITSYHEKVMSVLAVKGDFKNRLTGFIKLQLEYGSYHKGFSQMFRALSRSSGKISKKIEIKIREKHQEIYEALTKEFSSAVRRKEIRAFPPGLLMQVLINATSFPVRSERNTEQTAEEVFSIFWSGISNK